MGLGDLLTKAKDMVSNRGGTDAVKEDATEVREDVSQDASMTDKAKDTAEDVKDPGAPGP